MKKLMNYGVVLFVIVIVLLLIIPLPPAIIDIMIVLNMSISMTILIITMIIKEPLEFSIFPSLLLITTLFRLGLNVSTTRNILTKMGSSGYIIKAFGDFILRGNVIVGFVIFIIIVLMQFIVITKGAERVAEVAARFNLDAMPGKQMAIDADLSSGLINEQQAKKRREKIQREADFFGAMDGATKIVKGDAVMSIIITGINLIGGTIIGTVLSGDGIQTVMKTYSIATVGDGLVSQIPALLISTATGMIVTRAGSTGSLNEDVSGQFKAQPHAIMLSGLVVFAMMLVPGMPKIQMIVISLLLIGGGNYLSKHMDDIVEESENEEYAREKEVESKPDTPVSEDEYFRNLDNVYSLLQVETIEMEFGYSLIPFADESIGGRLISRIVVFRRQYAQDMGFVIPSVRLKDSSYLTPNEYSIKIKGEEVAKGEILPDYYLAIEPDNPLEEIDGIETIEPAYGIPSKWILPENRESAESFGYTVIDPLSVMIAHFTEIVKQYSYELINRQEVVKLVDNMKKTAPSLVEEAFPNVISYNVMQKILSSLLKDEIPIKDLETIIETAVDYVHETGLPLKDINALIERVRLSLKRTISRMYTEDGIMNVVTLDSELERNLVSAISKGESGYYLAPDAQLLQSIIKQFAEATKHFNAMSQTPVVITSAVLRKHFADLIEQFYPKVKVLSFNEISNNVQIQSIAGIRYEKN